MRLRRAVRWLACCLLLGVAAAGGGAQAGGFEPADQEAFDRRLDGMTLVASVYGKLEAELEFSSHGEIMHDNAVVARAVYVRSDHNSGILSFRFMPDFDRDERIENCLVLLKFSSPVNGDFVLVPGAFPTERCTQSDKRIWGVWRIEERAP